MTSIKGLKNGDIVYMDKGGNWVGDMYRGAKKAF